MIIGLSGKMRSGKDTVADILVEHGFKKYAFAETLKECVYRLNPIIDVGYGNLNPFGEEYNYTRYRDLVNDLGLEEAKKNKEVRRLLQVFGTEVGREMFGENFWVERLMDKIDNDSLAYWDDYQKEMDLVISDVRFDNEAEAILNKGGIVIEITRKGNKPPNNHVSEKGISEHLLTGRIRNDGTLEELKDLVEDLWIRKS